MYISYSHRYSNNTPCSDMCAISRVIIHLQERLPGEKEIGEEGCISESCET